jgi:hypothetical protein
VTHRIEVDVVRMRLEVVAVAAAANLALGFSG